MTHPPMSQDPEISLPLKRFLLVEECPIEWRRLDLYLFRDGEVVFYVGQSSTAFARVWDHLKGGFRGRSIVGRFIWCNWPKSMNFQIELMSSASSRFAALDHDLNAAEVALIQQWSPCFNVVLNHEPTPLPDSYAPPTAPWHCARHLGKLIREAERAVKAEERQSWLADSASSWQP